MKIAIKLASGGTAVMTLIAEVNESESIEKFKEANPGAYVSHRIITDQEVPDNRRFRSAWSYEGKESKIAVDFDKAKALLKSECYEIASAKREAVVSGTSAAEMALWSLKRSEALSFAEGGEESAPNLSAEARERGITLAELVGKVLANSAHISASEALIAGANGRHIDAIDKLSTIAELDSYDVSVGWPS